MQIENYTNLCDVMLVRKKITPKFLSSYFTGHHGIIKAANYADLND